MGEEGLDIELETQPLPLKDKGLPGFSSLPPPCEVLCSLTWVFLPKGGNLPQEGLYHDHCHYCFYHFEDWFLNFTFSPAFRPASVVYFLDS